MFASTPSTCGKEMQSLSLLLSFRTSSPGDEFVNQEDRIPAPTPPPSPSASTPPILTYIAVIPFSAVLKYVTKHMKATNTGNSSSRRVARNLIAPAVIDNTILADDDDFSYRVLTASANIISNRCLCLRSLQTCRPRNCLIVDSFVLSFLLWCFVVVPTPVSFKSSRQTVHGRAREYNPSLYQTRRYTIVMLKKKSLAHFFCCYFAM